MRKFTTFPTRPGGLVLRIIVAVGAVAAPSAAPAAPAPQAITFADGRGTVEVTERLRVERRENNFDFDSAAPSATDRC